MNRGTTLLHHRPRVLVLSTSNISRHCSYCCAEPVTKRCSGCQTVWYCDSVSVSRNENLSPKSPLRLLTPDLRCWGLSQTVTTMPLCVCATNRPWDSSQACQKWDWALHKSECRCLGRVITLSSDQENPSIPPDAVRCLARISFAKLKYGLDSEIVRENLSEDLPVWCVELMDLVACLHRPRNLIRSIPVCLVPV